MSNRLSRVESDLRALERALGVIERRIAVLEDRLGITENRLGESRTPSFTPALGEVFPAGAPEPAATAVLEIGSGAILNSTLIGRTFVALGGAYFSRALTDTAVVPQRAGLALGLMYGIIWLVLADRAGARGRHTSAAFHALVSAIITLPIIWEAVTRFRLLGSTAGAAVLAVVTASSLVVAVRQRLPALAWIAVSGALTMTLALISTTGDVLPFASVLVALGLATLWLGYTLDWIWLRWPAALIADIAVLSLAVRVSNRSWPDNPFVVIAVQLVLLTGYLASIAIRTLIRGREVDAFEVLQAAAVLAIGFGGAVYVAQSTGLGSTALAVINLAIGIGCYGIAFAFVAPRQGPHRNVHFYATLALILVLASTPLLLASSPVAWTLSALAVGLSWLAWRTGRVALDWHATAYLLAAAGASGLLSGATRALVGRAAIAVWTFPMAALLVLGACAAGWLLPPPAQLESSLHGTQTHRAPREIRVPRLVVASLLIWSLSGCLVAGLAVWLPTSRGGALDMGMIATARTSILALDAIAVACIGRYDRFREAAWLLYPVLVAGGLKLILEDFPRSRPSTLSVALLFYGTALLAAPRWARHHRPRHARRTSTVRDGAPGIRRPTRPTPAVQRSGEP